MEVAKYSSLTKKVAEEENTKKLDLFMLELIPMKLLFYWLRFDLLANKYTTCFNRNMSNFLLYTLWSVFCVKHVLCYPGSNLGYSAAMDNLDSSYFLTDFME